MITKNGMVHVTLSAPQASLWETSSEFRKETRQVFQKLADYMNEKITLSLVGGQVADVILPGEKDLG